MERKYTVYKHTSPSGKVYIGITSIGVARRWQNGNGYKTQPVFHRAIIKYGWKNIKHEILLDNISEEEAKLKEKEYISFYNSNNPSGGYNRTAGGDGTLGYSLTEEAKRKISEAHKGKFVSEETRNKQSKSIKDFYENNPEYKIRLSELNKGKKHSTYTRARISEAHKGEKNYWYGKNIPLDIRQKMSISHTGKKMSDEAKMKIRKANIGKVLSEDHKKKISNSNKGGNHWNFGRSTSKETKKKMSESHKGQVAWNKGKKIEITSGSNHHSSKKIICTTTGEVFNCQREAGEFYKIKTYNNINTCCRGKRNYCGKLSDGTKLRWMYYEDYLKLHH